MQYLRFFNSIANGIIWFEDSLICPSSSNRSKILFAFVTSNSYFSSSFLANEHENGSLFLVHSAKPISASSSELEESPAKLIFFCGRVLPGIGAWTFTYASLWAKWLNEWRMYVDYTDLNKHCPKYPFGLPHIDQVIDSTAGCILLSFLDCYSSYHKIALSMRRTRSRWCLSPRMRHMPSRPCPSGWRTQELPTSGRSSFASPTSYIATLKLIWMTSSPKPRLRISSSLI